jgi:hypothetical protein
LTSNTCLSPEEIESKLYGRYLFVTKILKFARSGLHKLFIRFYKRPKQLLINSYKLAHDVLTISYKGIDSIYEGHKYSI